MPRNIQKWLRVRILFLVPAVAYTLVVLYLSLINLSDTPVRDLGLSDKIMHGGAYFFLGLIWMLFVLISYNNDRYLRKIAIISGLVILFGIFIEVLQDRLTTYRQLDLLDILANTLGVLSAGFIVWLLKDSLTRLKAKINLIFTKK